LIEIIFANDVICTCDLICDLPITAMLM